MKKYILPSIVICFLLFSGFLLQTSQNTNLFLLTNGTRKTWYIDSLFVDNEYSYDECIASDRYIFYQTSIMEAFVDCFDNEYFETESFTLLPNNKIIIAEDTFLIAALSSDRMELIGNTVVTTTLDSANSLLPDVLPDTVTESPSVNCNIYVDTLTGQIYPPPVTGGPLPNNLLFVPCMPDTVTLPSQEQTQFGTFYNVPIRIIYKLIND
jgi:hypothetical protein